MTTKMRRILLGPACLVTGMAWLGFRHFRRETLRQIEAEGRIPMPDTFDRANPWTPGSRPEGSIDLLPGNRVVPDYYLEDMRNR